NHRFDLDKNWRARFNLRRIKKQNGGDRCFCRFPVEWPTPTDHLVQHHAETEDVAARIESFSAKLFRRHVRSGSGDHSRPAEKVCLFGFVIEDLGQTEIQNLYTSS